jgi:hypothetical protein
MIAAVDPSDESGVQRDTRALEAYDVLRAKVGDALALADAADDVLDAVPNVREDRYRSRRLSRLHYCVRTLRDLLDEIVIEGEKTANELVRGSSSAAVPSDEQSAVDVLDDDDDWEEIIGPQPPQPPPIRGPSPRSEPRDFEITRDQIKQIEEKALRKLRSKEESSPARRKASRSVSRTTDGRRSRR